MHFANFKNRKSFTLIEIIVVLIILGVLAALALPAYFGMIERSRAAEVVPVLKNMADQLDACFVKNGDGTFTGCTASGSSPHFSNVYVSFFIVGTWSYHIMAIRNSLDSPYGSTTRPPAVTCYNGGNSQAITDDTYGGFVTLCYDPGTGARTLHGGGIYAGMF